MPGALRGSAEWNMLRSSHATSILRALAGGAAGSSGSGAWRSFT